MKILYVSQYFYPEVCAPVNRAYSNAKLLSKMGHDITVVSEIPNHPKGLVFPGYKNKIYQSDNELGFKTIRLWVFTSKKKNFITRLLFYFSFLFSALIYTLFNFRKYDLIYISSPPLFVALIGIVLKKIAPKKKVVFEVRDLWPDSAIQLGELKNKLLIKFSFFLEKNIYKLANKIVAISIHMKNEIIKKGIVPNKVAIVHNGTDLNSIQVNKRLKRDEIYKNNTDKFIVIYAGNVGLAQNLEVIVDVAEILKNEKDIFFYIIGEGPNKQKLKDRKKQKKIDNISFIDEISRKDIHNYLYQADCGVIPLRDLKLFHGALPSKIFDYLACGLPILVGIEGEAKKLVNESNTGLYYKPENPSDLATKIMYLYKNRDTLNEFSNNARPFVEENFTRKKLAKKLEKILSEV
jgi:glycosyltransferase involved in cell wall biosynthesis